VWQRRGNHVEHDLNAVSHHVHHGSRTAVVGGVHHVELCSNGAGDEYGSCMNHNPGYDFNDGILPGAAAYWSWLAKRFLA